LSARRLIGFAGYHDANTFLVGLQKYIRRFRRGRFDMTFMTTPRWILPFTA
jgi:hypothetical protein